MLSGFALNLTAPFGLLDPRRFSEKPEELHCFDVAPNCPRCKIRNDPYTVDVQGDVEEQDDEDGVDAGRQMNALTAAALFSAYRGARGCAAGASVKAQGLEPNAFADG